MQCLSSSFSSCYHSQWDWYEKHLKKQNNPAQPNGQLPDRKSRMRRMRWADWHWSHVLGAAPYAWSIFASKGMKIPFPSYWFFLCFVFLNQVHIFHTCCVSIWQALAHLFASQQTPLSLLPCPALESAHIFFSWLSYFPLHSLFHNRLTWKYMRAGAFFFS